MNNRCPALGKWYLLLLFSLMAFYFLGHPSVQYRTVLPLYTLERLTEERKEWVVRGSTNNVLFSETAVSLQRQVDGFTGVYKNLKLPAHEYAYQHIQVLVMGETEVQSSKTPAPATSVGKPQLGKANLALQFFNDKGQKIQTGILGEIPERIGDFDFLRVFKIPPQTEKVRFAVLLRNADISFTVSRTKIDIVEIRPLQKIMVTFLAMALLLAMFFMVIRVLPLVGIGFVSLGAIVLLGSLVLFTIPVEMLLRILPVPIPAGNHKMFLTSVSHTTVFFIIGLYCFFLLYKLRLPQLGALPLLLLLAGLSETSQLYFVGRSFSLNDILFDILGIMMALAVWLVYIYFTAAASLSSN